MHRNRRHAIQALAISVGICSVQPSRAFSDETEKTTKARFPGIAVFSPSIIDPSDTLKNSMVKRFGCAVLKNKSEDNPGCCVWVDLISPDSSKPGWIYLQAEGGAVLLGTDVKQLVIAIEALWESSDEIDGGRYLKIGVATSFPINDLT